MLFPAKKPRAWRPEQLSREQSFKNCNGGEPIEAARRFLRHPTAYSFPVSISAMPSASAVCPLTTTITQQSAELKNSVSNTHCHAVPGHIQTQQHLLHCSCAGFPKDDLRGRDVLSVLQGDHRTLAREHPLPQWRRQRHHQQLLLPQLGVSILCPSRTGGAGSGFRSVGGSVLGDV